MNREQIDQNTMWEPNSGCLIWLASLNNNGYGQLRFEGRQRLAHRVIYQLSGREIPDGMCLLHRCDNRPCCNPDHLFIGTRADNQADMARKGRGRGRGLPGEGNGFARLSEKDVTAIRASSDPQHVLAARFGVAQTTISAVKRRETWGHIP